MGTFKDLSTDSEAQTTSETASTADSTLTLLRELLGHVTIYSRAVLTTNDIVMLNLDMLNLFTM